MITIIITLSVEFLFLETHLHVLGHSALELTELSFGFPDIRTFQLFVTLYVSPMIL